MTVALVAAPAVVIGLLLAGRAAASEQQRQQQQQSPDVEVQLGQEVFDELKAKGMVVVTSPLYDTLKPLEAQIVRVAQPHYEHPFRFAFNSDPRSATPMKLPADTAETFLR